MENKENTLSASDQENIQIHDNATPDNKTKRSSFVFLIVALLFILFAGAFWARSIVRNVGEKVDPFTKMFEVLKETNSLTYLGEISSKTFNNLDSEDASDIKTDEVEWTLSFEGSTDITDINSSKSKIKLLYEIKGGALGSEGTSAELEIRNFGNVAYINLLKSPILGFFTLSPIENRWIKFDMPIAPSEEQNELTESQKKTSEEYIDKIKDLYSSHRPFDVKRLSDEMVNGQLSFRYELKMDKERFILFWTDIYDHTLEKLEDGSFDEMLDESFFTHKDIFAEFETEMDKMLDGLQDHTAYLWIDKQAYFPSRIYLKAIYETLQRFPASAPLFGNDQQRTKQSETVIDIYFKDINKPIQIEEPSTYETFEEIIESLFGGIMGSSEPIFEF